VDRLFDPSPLPPPADPLVAQLAAIDLQLEAHRRVRRRLSGGAILASVLSWAHARLAIAPLVCALPLFGFFALSAASLYFHERRLVRRRQRLVAGSSAQVRRQIGGCV
jgi:hypothetical protein